MRKLLEIPLLSLIPEETLVKLFEEGKLYSKKYTKGSTVYEEKDKCKSFDLLLKGELVAYSLNENGSALTMFTFRKDQMLGANLLFGDTNSYPFTIYCGEDAQILHVSKEAVQVFLETYAFTMEFVRMLSLNSQKLNQKITMAMHRSLRENLLDYLRQQELIQGSEDILLPITKKQLADYLGVRRPSLFRELKKMQEEGLLINSNRRIRLL